MRLRSKDVSFGRHETFPLRFGWLTKGVDALLRDGRIFEREDATVKLGVGKNMVASIRYWLQATRVAERPKQHFEPTSIARELFGDRQGGGYDRYLEDEGTLWLLHWLIATNTRMATSLHWFFNHFHKPIFTSDELSAALRDFVKTHVQNPPATSTLKSDATLITRMYTPTSPNRRIPAEDALDSPLALLGLVTHGAAPREFSSIPRDPVGLPNAIFGFATAEVFKHLRATQLTLEQLHYSSFEHCAPGAVFRLTENALLSHIDRLVASSNGALELRETAGLSQLYRIRPLEPMSFLRAYYDSTDEAA